MGAEEIAELALRLHAEAEVHSAIHRSRIVDAVHGVGGSIARLATEIKTVESLSRKVTKLAEANRAIRINDSVRYTAVLDFATYWELSGALVRDLRRNGYSVPNPSGWFAKGYQGMNLTVVDDATGFEFELQFHTPDSLTASEETHDWYRQARDRSTQRARRTELRRLIAERYALVSLPPKVPVLS